MYGDREDMHGWGGGHSLILQWQWIHVCLDFVSKVTDVRLKKLEKDYPSFLEQQAQLEDPVARLEVRSRGVVRWRWGQWVWSDWRWGWVVLPRDVKFFASWGSIWINITLIPKKKRRLVPVEPLKLHGSELNLHIQPIFMYQIEQLLKVNDRWW